MSVITVQLGGKTGDYIKTIPASAKRAAEQQLGILEYVIITIFLLFAGSLVYLALH